jgi:hypothetical protein
MDSHTTKSSNHSSPLEAQTMHADPKQGTNGFLDLGMGDSPEEQILINQLAMKLLESWNEKYSVENVEAEVAFKHFLEIVDSNRPPESNVFSKDF